MKFKIIGVLIFLSWINFVHAEWSLIDDFEEEQLDDRDIVTTALNLHGAFSPVYIDDPSSAFSQVFNSGYYERYGVVSLVFPIVQDPVEAESVATVYLRYNPIGNDANAVTSFGFDQIEVGVGEGAGLAEHPFLFATTFGDIEKLMGTDLITPDFIEKRWYEIWLVVDRSEGFLETYYRRMGDDEIIFNGSSDFSKPDSGDRFDHFYWSSAIGATHYEPLFNGIFWFIDDIYIDTSGKNLTSPSGVRQPDRLWSGYAVYDGEVNTLDWLGWLSLRADSSWAWSYGLENWLYFPEPEESQSGGWAYIIK